MQFGLALSTRRESPASLQIIAFRRHSHRLLLIHIPISIPIPVSTFCSTRRRHVARLESYPLCTLRT